LESGHLEDLDKTGRWTDSESSPIAGTVISCVDLLVFNITRIKRLVKINSMVNV